MPKIIHILNLGNTFHKNYTQKTHAIVFKPDLFLYSKLSKKKKEEENCFSIANTLMSIAYYRYI